MRWRGNTVADIYTSVAGRRTIESFYRRALDRWPVPHDELTVSTRQGATFVVASGDPDAPPLVLFHGSGTNSSSWIRDVATWARDYRVYAVDMIGEPGFSAPSRPPLASGAYAEWLDDVWDGLALSQASVAGVSLGGWLALDFAVRRPARVASLSLVSPSGIGRQNRLSLLRIGVLRMCGDWGLRRSMQFVAGSTMVVPPQLAEYLKIVFRSFKPRMTALPIRSDAELRALTMPVQAIVGGRDVLLHSDETRSRLERLVPHARVTVVDDAGHLLPPQTQVIAEFLADVTRSLPVAASSLERYPAYS